MSDYLNNLLENVKRQLAADKKKSLALGVLFLVFVVVLGRLFVGDSEPRQATAATPTVPTSIPTPAPLRRPVPQVVKRVIPSQVHVASHSSASSSHSGVVAVSGLQKRIAVDDVQLGLRRDLFRPSSWNLFKPVQSVGSSASQEGAGKGVTGFFAQLAERLSESEKARRQTMQQLRKELEQLELQSTMTGDRRLAYISGRMLREGDQISGFSVVRIADRHVQLRKSGVTQTLNMP